jgi:NADH-quinone oxidoreductase subunit L
MLEYVWLIPLFPLLGAVFNGLFGKKIKNEAVIGGIATLMIFCSFLVSCGILMQLIGLPAEERVFEKVVFPWIYSGNFKADMAFLVDPLSAIMLMVVTGVGSLIHLYSIGYMHGEEDSTATSPTSTCSPCPCSFWCSVRTCLSCSSAGKGWVSAPTS